MITIIIIDLHLDVATIISGTSVVDSAHLGIPYHARTLGMLNLKFNICPGWRCTWPICALTLNCYIFCHDWARDLGTGGQTLYQWIYGSGTQQKTVTMCPKGQRVHSHGEIWQDMCQLEKQNSFSLHESSTLTAKHFNSGVDTRVEKVQTTPQCCTSYPYARMVHPQLCLLTCQHRQSAYTCSACYYQRWHIMSSQYLQSWVHHASISFFCIPKLLSACSHSQNFHIMIKYQTQHWVFSAKWDVL